MAGRTHNKCSFCGRSDNEVPLMLTGINGYICSDCVQNAYEMLKEFSPDAKKSGTNKKSKETTDKNFVSFLLSIKQNKILTKEILVNPKE